MFSNPTSFKYINPKELALFLLATAILLASALFYPISRVFRGDWKLNQQIILLDKLDINFEKLGIYDLVQNLALPKEITFTDVGVRFYTILILVGVLAGYAMALYLCKWHFIAGTIIDRLILGLVAFGLVGARLFFVIFNWEFFSADPAGILTDISRGGLAFFGMFIACTLYLIFYCYKFKFNLWEFLDFLSPSVLLGQVIGRFGNFFNYEAYGGETSVFWKMYVPLQARTDLNVSFNHPTFLYEIIPNFLLLVFLLWKYEDYTKRRSGLIFAGYAMGYGAIRLITEFFRLDALKIQLPEFLTLQIFNAKFEYLLVSQLIAFCLMLTGIYIFSKRNKVIYLKKSMEEFKF